MENICAPIISAKLTLFLLLISICSAARAASSEAMLPIDVIEDNVLQARRSIKSARFDILYERDGFLTQNITTWLDADGKVREDSRKGEDIRIVCFSGDIYYRLGGNAKSLAFTDRSRRPVVKTGGISSINKVSPFYRIRSPLVMMLQPDVYEISSSYGLEYLIHSPLRTNLASASAIWNGHAAVDISFETSDTHNEGTYTVVPSLGYSIVAFKVQDAATHGATFVYESSCVPKDFGGGMWFPTELRTVHHTKGAITAREHITVSLSMINQKLDPAIFSVEGMSLPSNIVIAGTQTNDGGTSAKQNLSIWDGHAVRPMHADDLAQIKASRIEPILKRTRRAYLLGASGISGLIGIAVYLLHIRRRPKAGKVT